MPRESINIDLARHDIRDIEASISMSAIHGRRMHLLCSESMRLSNRAALKYSSLRCEFHYSLCQTHFWKVETRIIDCILFQYTCMRHRYYLWCMYSLSLDLCAPFFVWQISNLPHFISTKSGANTGARIKRSCEILERQDHYWCVWFMARASRHSQNTCMLLLVVLMDDVDALIVTAAGVDVIMSVV